MAMNPAGYVPIFDGGNPRIIGGNAKALISGGMFVFTSGATGVVSSGANSFTSADITFAPAASGLQFNGIAVQTAASGSTIAVATRGSFLLRCYSGVTAGYPVKTEGTHAVADAALAEGGARVGRALTGGASGGFAVIDINA